MATSLITPENAYTDSGASPPAAANLDFIENEIRQAWGRLERHGLEFGHVCFEAQKTIRAQGKKDAGLCAMLDKVGIPRSTAYYWIHRYKDSVRLTKTHSPEQADKEASSQAQSSPSSLTNEKATATTTEPRNERYKNRGKPADFETLRRLALDALDEGFKILRNTKPSAQIVPAQKWARFTLEHAQ